MNRNDPGSVYLNVCAYINVIIEASTQGGCGIMAVHDVLLLS